MNKIMMKQLNIRSFLSINFTYIINMLYITSKKIY